MSVTMQLEGFSELEKELENLSKSMGKGVLRRSLKKSAGPMVDLIKSKAPHGRGALSNSVAVSTKLDPRQRAQHRKMFRDDRASIEMFIGPSYNIGDGGRHGHLVEFGTKPHVNGGKFAGTLHPGTPPQPFMRPAWEQDKVAMLDRLGKELWRELEKSLTRAARKAARG